MGERKVGLIATITLAVLVLVSVSTALLVFDPRATGADALRTGGLAAGSVIALYALWLNDRRRRVEEQRQELDRRKQELDDERYELEQRRQELEHRRTDHDRDRAADERFARAVELLGHEADQVRVGALHALAGLARTRADYTQTVLDVLCSYLRRPLDHPKWSVPNDATSTIPAASEEVERERTVRQAAIRLITELLPSTAAPEPPIYDLDLSYAHLELVDLRDKVVGRMAAFSARFRHTVHLDRTHFRGQLHMRGATFVDEVRAREARFFRPLKARDVRLLRAVTFESAQFLDAVSFRGMRCQDRASFQDALFRGAVDLRDVRFDRALDLRIRKPAPEFALTGTEVDVAAPVDLPPGWSLTELPNGNRTSITPP